MVMVVYEIGTCDVLAKPRGASKMLVLFETPAGYAIFKVS